MILNDLVQVKNFRARSIIQNSRNTTINGRDIVSKLGSQKWAFGITTTELTESEFLELMVNIAAQEGSFGEFQIKIPFGAQNFDKSTVKVSASALAGQTIVPMGEHGAIMAGTFVKFSNHSKVYQVRSSTTTAITIYPALVEQVTIGVEGQIDEPVATVRNADDMAELELFEFNRAQSYDLTLVEVI